MGCGAFAVPCAGLASGSGGVASTGASGGPPDGGGAAAAGGIGEGEFVACSAATSNTGTIGSSGTGGTGSGWLDVLDGGSCDAVSGDADAGRRGPRPTRWA